MAIGGGKGEAMFDNRADGRGVQEFWTFTCAHCNVVRYVNPATGNIVRMRVIRKMPENEVVDFTWREVDPPLVCRKCMAQLCDNPACHLDCLPVKAGIDLILGKGQAAVTPFATDERSRYELSEAYKAGQIFQGVSLEGPKE